MKVSIEFPVATRHCRDMTEKLIKAMLNRNKQTDHTNQMSQAMRKSVYVICEQQRCRSVCASGQSDQHFSVRF